MGRRRFRARADAAGRIARGAHRERTGAIERAGGAGRNGRVSPRAAAAALWRESARTLRQLRQLPRAHGAGRCDRARAAAAQRGLSHRRSEEHTSELQSLMRISYAVFCLKKKKKTRIKTRTIQHTDN